VNEFVDTCRREWRRLRVPAAVADEMAADLAADLAEAEAEGVSREDLLGSGARDARSFAAAWAASRGVARPSRVRFRATTVAFAAITTFCALAAAGAALAISAAPHARTPECATPLPTTCAVLPVQSPAPNVLVPITQDDSGWTVVVAPGLHAKVAGADRSLGFSLLGGGLVGALLALAWLWRNPRGSSRRSAVAYS
jgi:disulfide bond formation protein DsbB